MVGAIKRRNYTKDVIKAFVPGGGDGGGGGGPDVQYFTNLPNSVPSKSIYVFHGSDFASAIRDSVKRQMGYPGIRSGGGVYDKKY